MNEHGGTIWRRFRWSAVIASGIFLLWFGYRYGFDGTDETIPGTTKVWSAVVTPDEDRPVIGIKVVDGIDQPIVSGGCVVSTIDGKTHRWDLNAALGEKSTRCIYALGSSADGSVLASLDDDRLIRLGKDGTISVHSLNTHISLNLDTFGADIDHFVARIGYDGRRFVKCRLAVSEPDVLHAEEQWTLPVAPEIGWVRNPTVVKASGNRWIALAGCEVVLGDANMHQLAAVELEVPAKSILRTGNDEFVLIPWGKFSPVCRLRVQGAVLEIDERWYCGRFVRAEAWSRERGLLLLVTNGQIRTKRHPWGVVSTQIATIELIDTRAWKPIAIHNVETSNEDRDLQDLWWEAAISPDGESLYVMHRDATVHEIDIKTWVKKSVHMLSDSSFIRL